MAQSVQGQRALDAKRYPEIHFVSTQIRSKGENRWIVTGNLTLHGETHPATAEVSSARGHYIGSATLSQREFGIKPFSAMMGALKVRDEVEIVVDAPIA